MAFASTLVTLMSLFLVATSLPSALSLILSGNNIAAANIAGVVYCINDNVPVGGTCRVVPRAPVELRCGTGSSEKVLKTVLCDLSGTYFFAFNLIDALLFDPKTCYLRIQIPSGSCVASFPTGILRAPLLVTAVVDAVLGGLTGNLCQCIAGPYTVVG